MRMVIGQRQLNLMLHEHFDIHIYAQQRIKQMNIHDRSRLPFSGEILANC